jgi:hypothetical protein
MVWVAYTLKARQWALERGYDSLVYTNHSEGGGADSYVTLLPNQLSKPTATYHFDKKQYLSKARTGIQNLVRKSETHSSLLTLPTQFYILWAGMEPITFWKKTEIAEPTS